MKTIPTISLPEFVWERNLADDQDPEAALISWVQIFGLDYHAEAIAVDDQGDALNSLFQGRIDALRDINGSDEPFYTVLINDRNYVVYFYPFAN